MHTDTTEQDLIVTSLHAFFFQQTEHMTLLMALEKLHFSQQPQPLARVLRGCVLIKTAM